MFAEDQILAELKLVGQEVRSVVPFFREAVKVPPPPSIEIDITEDDVDMGVTEKITPEAAESMRMNEFKNAFFANWKDDAMLKGITFAKNLTAQHFSSTVARQWFNGELGAAQKKKSDVSHLRHIR